MPLCLLHGRKASGSALITMLSKHILNQLPIVVLDGYIAFYRHCSPRSVSFTNDTTIVRNFYPTKFHPLWKSKKLSKDLIGICI